MKRQAVDWEEETFRVENAARELALRKYREVMCLVPNEVWALVVELLSEKKSKFIFTCLTLVSKQLHSVVHQSAPKIPIELMAMDQYPNLQVLSIPFQEKEPKILSSTSLKRVIIFRKGRQEMTEGHVLNLIHLESEKFPNLLSITFDKRSYFNSSHVCIPEEMLNQITSLKCKNGAVGFNEARLFPNISSISCAILRYHVTDTWDFSKISRLKVLQMSSSCISTFNGQLIHSRRKIKYQIKKGLFCLKQDWVPAIESTLYLQSLTADSKLK